MKILCFHPALAPYRVDFFNLLGERVNLRIVFLQGNLQSQKFDQSRLLASLRVPHAYLTHGICIGGRCVRTGILKTVRRERPDVILSYESSPVTLALIFFKKLNLIRSEIWTFMDDCPEQICSRKGLRKIIRDFVMRNVVRIIVPSREAANVYPALKPSATFSIVPIVHDTVTMLSNQRTVRLAGMEWRQRNIPASWNKVLLFVGRLTAIKNIPWLIDRMTELPANVGLVLVGDGDDEVPLKRIVEDKSLNSRIVFAGRMEDNELYAMMAMADGLVLCSHSETFGAVVAEALQWGTPCIVARHLGASVLIEDGVNGKVFGRNDAEAFNVSVAKLPAKSDVSMLPCDLRTAVDLLVGTLKR